MFEILFQYGAITVRTFNVLIALGFLSGIFFLIKYINCKKMNLSFVMHYFFHFLIALLIGGRLFFILENFSFFQKNPIQSLYFWDLQFSSFGAFYMPMLILFILTRIKKEDFWAWLDAFALSGIITLIFIHIGHFFNGTQYGKPTDLPWGITFDTPNIPFFSPLHPTQLYAAIITFFIFIFGIYYYKRIHLSGMVGTIIIMLYSISVGGIDFLRGAPSMYTKISFTIIAALSFIFFIHCSHKKISLPN